MITKQTLIDMSDTWDKADLICLHKSPKVVYLR